MASKRAPTPLSVFSSEEELCRQLGPGTKVQEVLMKAAGENRVDKTGFPEVDQNHVSLSVEVHHQRPMWVSDLDRSEGRINLHFS